MRNSLIVLILLWPFIAALPAEPNSRAFSRDEPVHLEADEVRYDDDQELYEASGKVRLTQGELEVLSEQMQWNRSTGELKADGDVRFLSPTETLTGSAACYNLETSSGRVEQGYFFLREDNFHFRGSLIEQLGEDDYRVSSGTLTTCDGAVPAWKFGASRIDVTMGGYARARNVLFYLKDTPVFYFPYMFYPTRTERKSGFLMPAIGHSSKRGYTFGSAYYQVLGVNQDATLYLDYLSEMGVGKGLEYRYVFGNENAGEARIYHINVDKVDGEPVDAERYALEWQHAGHLPGGVRMVADALYVNDDDYFADFGEIAGDYNRNQAVSRFSLSKNWGKYNLVGLLNYTKNLQTDQHSTLQLLPRITFNVARQRIAQTPFSYALGMEYTHFWRREGAKGQRLMVRPLLSYNTQLFDLISVAPAIAYRQRYYWGLNEDQSTADRGIAEFTTQFATPPLQRIYTLPGNGPQARLHHSLQPEIVYDYVPEARQDQLPSFDRYDRIAAANRLEYALVQRLRLRTEQEDGHRQYRDLLYFRFSILQHLTNDNEDQGFGKLRSQLTLRPLERFRISADLTYDTRTDEWERILLENGVSDKRGNQLQLIYNKERLRDLDYGAVNLSLAFLHPVYLSYEQRYDFDNNDRLEQRLGIEYRHQCWSVLLALRERTDGDKSFMVTFTMYGIGSVGGVSGRIGSNN